MAGGYNGKEAQEMATIDWSRCPLVEVIPGKIGGTPLLKNTRLPVDAITGNYDAFRDEGLSAEAAIAEALDCYPAAGLDTIKAILGYRATLAQARVIDGEWGVSYMAVQMEKAIHPGGPLASIQRRDPPCYSRR
jgi:uncharacterized protein (DUF433 family)